MDQLIPPLHRYWNWLKTWGWTSPLLERGNLPPPCRISPSSWTGRRRRWQAHQDYPPISPTRAALLEVQYTDCRLVWRTSTNFLATSEASSRGAGLFVVDTLLRHHHLCPDQLISTSQLKCAASECEVVPSSSWFLLLSVGRWVVSLFVSLLACLFFYHFFCWFVWYNWLGGRSWTPGRSTCVPGSKFYH